MTASVTISPEPFPAAFHLPPLDAGLPDLLISNGGLTSFVAFGADAAVGPSAQGCIAIPALGTVMVRGLAASATEGTVMGMMRTGPLTFQRVAAGLIVTYPCVEVGG